MLRFGWIYFFVAFFYVVFFLLGLPDWKSLGTSYIEGWGDVVLVQWIFHQITENLLSGVSLFDGKIFYPSTDTLAYSESMLFPALMYRGLLTLLGNKILSFNLCLIGFILLDFLAGFFALGRYFKSSASLLGAGVFAFSMIRLAQIGHIQLLPQFFSPLVLLSLASYARQASVRKMLWAAVFLAGQFYCCIYLGLMLAACLIPFFLIEIGKGRKKAGFHAFAFIITFILLVFPILYPYWKVSQQNVFVRSLSEAHMYSAFLENYFYAHPSTFWSFLTRFIERGGQLHEKRLFIGGVALALSIYGALRMKKFISEKKYRIHIWAFFLIAIILSSGPQWGLYTVLYYLMPGFKAIRVPSRFAFEYLMGVSIFVAIGTQVLMTKVPYGKSALFGVLVLLFSWENRLPVRMNLPEQRYAGLTAYLKRISGVHPIMHYPFLAEQDVDRMAALTEHGRPIGNGYAGFTPQSILRWKNHEEKIGLEKTLLHELYSTGFRHLVVDKGPNSRMDRWSQLSSLVVAYEDTYVIAYQIEP